MFESQVGMHQLTFVGGYEGIGTDEVDLGLRADDVGHDSGGILVGVYLRV